MFDMDEIVNRQTELQKAYGTYPVQSDADRNAILTDNILALEDELHEAMSEYDWKRWSDSSVMDVERVKDELRDAFQFFINCMVTVGMTPDELYTKLLAKQEINWGRIHNNYKARIAHRVDVEEMQ